MNELKKIYENEYNTCLFEILTKIKCFSRAIIALTVEDEMRTMPNKNYVNKKNVKYIV